MSTNFRILGAGIWGMAFSDYLAQLGHNIEVFCRDSNSYGSKDFLKLNFNKLKSSDIQPLANLNSYNPSEAINIVAVNSKGFNDILKSNKSYFKKANELISLTKGIDHHTGLLFHDLVSKMFGDRLRYGLISGPSFASDLVNKKTMSVSFASSDKDLRNELVNLTQSTYFSMQPTDRVIHIEIAGVIKNIAAILCGMSDFFFGKNKYTNLIIKKACNEAWEISSRALDNFDLSNDKESIISSPGFIGDMILTCKQNQSRNYSFGNLIADSNMSAKEAKSEIGTVEGYDCCISLVDNSSLYSGDLVNLVYDIVCNDNANRKYLVERYLQI